MDTNTFTAADRAAYFLAIKTADEQYQNDCAYALSLYDSEFERAREAYAATEAAKSSGPSYDVAEAKRAAAYSAADRALVAAITFTPQGY